MRTLTGRNVNALWSHGYQTLVGFGVEQDSRAGRVKVMDSPVVSIYERPQERVLFDPYRDANPFFHLMESLWMLAGRDDAAFLNRYVANFGERFAEEGRYIHGAYGSRWREAFGYDQLDVVVEKLRTNPDDRQAVIQMWDATPDCMNDDLRVTVKDRPCNTHCYLRVRRTDEGMRALCGDQRVLDLTVLCRSNDIVWGAYGANAVHFSVLQEYLAGRIGVGIGKMYQVSNNYHGYTDVLNKFAQKGPGTPWNDPYELGQVQALPMASVWDRWDDDLSLFMDWHDNVLWASELPSKLHGIDGAPMYANSWFAHTAVPVAQAYWHWKRGRKEDALALWAEAIDAPDWRMACVTWMQRRLAV